MVRHRFPTLWSKLLTVTTIPKLIQFSINNPLILITTPPPTNPFYINPPSFTSLSTHPHPHSRPFQPTHPHSQLNSIRKNGQLYIWQDQGGANWGSFRWWITTWGRDDPAGGPTTCWTWRERGAWSFCSFFHQGYYIFSSFSGPNLGSETDFVIISLICASFYFSASNSFVLNFDF